MKVFCLYKIISKFIEEERKWLLEDGREWGYERSVNLSGSQKCSKVNKGDG
jgi:hypothetical protein